MVGRWKVAGRTPVSRSAIPGRILPANTWSRKDYQHDRSKAESADGKITEEIGLDDGVTALQQRLG